MFCKKKQLVLSGSLSQIILILLLVFFPIQNINLIVVTKVAKDKVLLYDKKTEEEIAIDEARGSIIQRFLGVQTEEMKEKDQQQRNKGWFYKLPKEKSIPGKEPYPGTEI